MQIQFFNTLLHVYILMEEIFQPYFQLYIYIYIYISLYKVIFFIIIHYLNIIYTIF